MSGETPKLNKESVGKLLGGKYGSTNEMTKSNATKAFTQKTIFLKVPNFFNLSVLFFSCLK